MTIHSTIGNTSVVLITWTIFNGASNIDGSKREWKRYSHRTEKNVYMEIDPSGGVGTSFKLAFTTHPHVSIRWKISFFAHFLLHIFLFCRYLLYLSFDYKQPPPSPGNVKNLKLVIPPPLEGGHFESASSKWSISNDLKV